MSSRSCFDKKKFSKCEKNQQQENPSLLKPFKLTSTLFIIYFLTWLHKFHLVFVYVNLWTNKSFYGQHFYCCNNCEWIPGFDLIRIQMLSADGCGKLDKPTNIKFGDILDTGWHNPRTHILPRKHQACSRLAFRCGWLFIHSRTLFFIEIFSKMRYLN
jgi:hypothetical protein